MTLKSHAITGGVAAVALYPSWGPEALMLWVATVAIDLDHYIDFVYHSGFRDFSIRKMFRYHDAFMKYWHDPGFLNVEVFHVAEFLVPFYLVAEFSASGAMKAAFWGMILHIALDMVSMARHGIFFRRSYSLTEYFIRKRRLEKMGLYPADVCRKALDDAGPGPMGRTARQEENC